MPGKRYEYDLFLPLYYNDGSEIPLHEYRSLQDRLIEEFRSLTIFPQANEGFWKMGDVTYRDEIIIFRVVATNRRTARRFLLAVKQELKVSLDQEEILIIERDVDTL